MRDVRSQRVFHWPPFAFVEKPSAGALHYTLAELQAVRVGGPNLVERPVVNCQIWFHDTATAQTVRLANGLEFQTSS